MNIDRFVLYKSGTSTGEEPITAASAITEILVAKLPTITEALELAIGVSFIRKELGNHKIAFQILDPDGKEVYDSYSMSMAVHAEKKAPQSSVGMIVERLHLRLSRHGEHVAELSVDGKHVATWKFVVNLLQ